MKEIIRKNKLFASFIMIFVISAITFKFYDVNRKAEIDDGKEEVYLVLRKDEISKGITTLVDEFNEKSETINIKLELYGNDFYKVLTNKLANKEKVDITLYTGKTQIEKEFIRSLDDVDIDYSNIKSGELVKFNGDAIAVKYSSSIPKLMYNKDILEKAGIDGDYKPSSFDDLMDMCKKIEEKVTGVTPLAFGVGSVHDIYAMIGAPSIGENSIYQSFWNYKEGKYEYSKAIDILKKYQYMYSNGYINNDFDEITDEALLNNFASGKTAIILTDYFKKNSVIDKTKGMNISFSDIPSNVDGGKNKYYYSYSKSLVIANNKKDESDNVDLEHDKAVKEVYEWLMSPDVTDYLVKNDNNYATFGENYYKNNVYDGINEDEGYIHEIYDPMDAIAGNSTIIRSGIVDIIKGTVDSLEGTLKLEEDYNKYIHENDRNDIVDFEKYKEK